MSPEERAEAAAEWFDGDYANEPRKLLTVEAAAEAIRQAVAAERERCSDIAADLARRLRRDATAAASEGDSHGEEDADALELCATAADDVAKAIREESPAPAWVATAPTAPGWYWWRGPRSCFAPTPVRLIVNRGSLAMEQDWTAGETFDSLAGEWCGPLEVPK